MNKDFGTGSSSVFKKAFAASVRIQSALEMTAAFHPPPNEVSVMGPRTWVRICSTLMMRDFFSGKTQWTSTSSRFATLRQASHVPQGFAPVDVQKSV